MSCSPNKHQAAVAGLLAEETVAEDHHSVAHNQEEVDRPAVPPDSPVAAFVAWEEVDRQVEEGLVEADQHPVAEE